MNTPKARSNRRGKYYLAEVALARGPQSIGAVGDASYGVLYGRNWALVLDREDNKLHLYQEQGGTWVEVPVPEIPHDGREIRHISLCFDQSARHVMAYERAGQVWARQWDAVAGAFTMRGPFPGVDPVLVQDATVGYYQPDSDVLLFCLSPDRKNLEMRVQRELFAVGHLIESYFTEKILDQAVGLPYQWELIGDELNVRSELYPVYLPTENLVNNTALVLGAGNYRPMVIVQDMGTEILSSGSALIGSANYRPMVVVVDGGMEALSAGSLAVGSGNYRALVLVVDVSANPETLSGGAFVPGAGNYRLVVVTVDVSANPEALSTGGFKTAGLGGSYL